MARSSVSLSLSEGKEVGFTIENMQTAGLICPITDEIMINPVITADGHSYEREAIAEWLRLGTRSPLTGIPLSRTEVIENINLKQAIRYLRSFYIDEPNPLNHGFLPFSKDLKVESEQSSLLKKLDEYNQHLKVHFVGRTRCYLDRVKLLKEIGAMLKKQTDVQFNRHQREFCINLNRLHDVAKEIGMKFPWSLQSLKMDIENYLLKNHEQFQTKHWKEIYSTEYKLKNCIAAIEKIECNTAWLLNTSLLEEHSKKISKKTALCSKLENEILTFSQARHDSFLWSIVEKGQLFEAINNLLKYKQGAAIDHEIDKLLIELRGWEIQWKENYKNNWELHKQIIKMMSSDETPIDFKRQNYAKSYEISLLKLINSAEKNIPAYKKDKEEFIWALNIMQSIGITIGIEINPIIHQCLRKLDWKSNLQYQVAQFLAGAANVLTSTITRPLDIALHPIQTGKDVFSSLSHVIQEIRHPIKNAPKWKSSLQSYGKRLFIRAKERPARSAGEAAAILALLWKGGDDDKLEPIGPRGPGLKPLSESSLIRGATIETSTFAETTLHISGVERIRAPFKLGSENLLHAVPSISLAESKEESKEIKSEVTTVVHETLAPRMPTVLLEGEELQSFNKNLALVRKKLVGKKLSTDMDKSQLSVTCEELSKEERETFIRNLALVKQRFKNKASTPVGDGIPLALSSSCATLFSGTSSSSSSSSSSTMAFDSATVVIPTPSPISSP